MRSSRPSGKWSMSSGKPNALSSTQSRQLDTFVGSRISPKVSALRIISKHMCDFRIKEVGRKVKSV